MKTKHMQDNEGMGLLLQTAAKSLSIVSSRGQLTVPQPVRELCRIRVGTVVAFEPQKEGVLLRPLKVVAEDPYTQKEWRKIEKLRREKGTKFLDADKAMGHMDSL